MVNRGPVLPPRSVAEDMETRVIPAKLSAILVARFRAVYKDGAALLSEKRFGHGVHSFLEHMKLGLDLIPGLERVTLVRV